MPVVRTDAKKRIIEQVDRCVNGLRAGTLAKEDLLKISDILDESAGARQDVLYLQANSSSPASPVMGMRIIEDGEISDGPDDPDEWPYQTVLDAVRAGWRIIKFPELALLLDESRTFGLGFEFILERVNR